MKINKKVNINIENIKNIYGNSGDLLNRTIYIKKKKIAYIYLESVSSDDKISDFLMKNISTLVKDDSLNLFKNLYDNLKNTIYNSNLSEVDKLDDILYRLSCGFTIIFVDGYDKAISIETRSTLDRGVVESTSENIIRGPKDSFTENPQINIGLIRKRIKDENLWIKDLKIGRRSKTKVSIAYINGVALDKHVKEIEEKLKKIDIDGILDSGYLKEFLSHNSSFPEMMSTERPDLVSGALLEGKIAIMVENSPFVLIIPTFLIDYIHTAEDYYQSPINVLLTRLLRFLSFILTVVTPGFYIAVTTWNQEVIPNELLISLSIQKSSVPFPTALELLLMIATFEILREADIRMPNASGAAISIVGALILGEAAVSAGIVSPIIIIVVAFTSISGLVYTDIDFINTLRWWRLIFIIFSTILGFIGLVIAFLIFLIKISSLEYFGIPYTIPTSPLYPEFLKDTFVRFSRKKIKYRAPYLSKNKTRLGDYK